LQISIEGKTFTTDKIEFNVNSKSLQDLIMDVDDLIDSFSKVGALIDYKSRTYVTKGIESTIYSCSLSFKNSYL